MCMCVSACEYVCVCVSECERKRESENSNDARFGTCVYMYNVGNSNVSCAMITGALRARNVHVQRWRILASLRRVDLISRFLQRLTTVYRRISPFQDLMSYGAYTTHVTTIVMGVPDNIIVPISTCTCRHIDGHHK